MGTGRLPSALLDDDDGLGENLFSGDVFSRENRDEQFVIGASADVALMRTCGALNVAILYLAVGPVVATRASSRIRVVAILNERPLAKWANFPADFARDRQVADDGSGESRELIEGLANRLHFLMG